MPRQKRRSPGRRKDRRDRSRSKSLSPYPRRDSHHHGDSYHSYNRGGHYRSSTAPRGQHRSRSPITHLASVSGGSSSTLPLSRRNRYSPDSRRDNRSSRDHSRKSFSPQPRHSPMNMKQRSRSPMWSGSRQVVPSVTPLEYSGQSSGGYKKSGQPFSHSSRGGSPSSYRDIPSTSSYRKMSPSMPSYSEGSYPPARALIPEDSYSRVALSRAYLQNHRRCSLTERFKMLDPDSPFQFDENITIGIHRSSQVASGSPRAVRRDFNPYDFVMIRQKNEGMRPIFDREELRQYGIVDVGEESHGYKELRVVTVAPTEREDYRQMAADEGHYSSGYRSPPHSSYLWNDDHYTYDRNTKEAYDSSRSVSGQRSSRDRWMGDIRMRPLLSTPPHRYGGGGGGGGLSVYPESSRGHSRDWERMERVQHNPDDLRHSISSRLTGSPRRKSGYQDVGSFYDREYTSKGRDKYDDWKDLADVSSRGSNYYEYDSKSDGSLLHDRERGRVRFRGRSRSILRRPFRPFRAGGILKRPIRLRTRASAPRGVFRTRIVGRFRTRSRGRISVRGRGRGGSSPGYEGSEDNFDKTDDKQPLSASET